MTIAARDRDRYEQLNSWPKTRPGFVIQHLDFRTKTVYITDSQGGKMLAFPFDRWLEVAKEIEPWT